MLRGAAVLVLLGIAVAVATSASPMAPAATTRPAKPTTKFPCEVLGDIDKIEFKEPSGIVFHPGRGTLFVVGDRGEICEIKTDGTPVNVKSRPMERRRDYEGITCNPATGLLYVAVEGEERIIEVDPGTLETKREFTIPRTFKGKTVMQMAGNGIEGITFVPNPKHPEGGTFYVSNQSFSLTSTTDISAIFEVEVPLKTGGSGDGQARILRTFSIGAIDLASLSYDRKRDLLYVVSDATNTLWEVTRKGAIVCGYILPGRTQEGFTLDATGHAYIAQDWGGIIKLKLLRPSTRPARSGPGGDE